uniref:Mediator of RNA polymerase II transcription subunit 33A n=1 Tax=Rhizophora mucronata TaxID=61149 RepID=A0A2P2K0V4_RHIMU
MQMCVLLHATFFSFSVLGLITAETIRTLQVFNRASWKETFLSLWLSALRLVQRERDPLEGPIPHLESRLCVLLTIVPLSIANILEDDACSSSLRGDATTHYMDITYEQHVGGKGQTSRKLGLISSLQVLGQFSGLLCPPELIIDAANIAAVKAACFICSTKNGKDGLVCGNYGDISVDAGGNMRHLIVEACISRNLIDTSAYFWPGYVSASVISKLDLAPVKKSPWLTFKEGAPLNNSLVNLLLTTPAPSLVEIEKLYQIALNGSVEEKSAAAKILCGASLSRGWNIQEHVVHYVVKLLSPPIPSTPMGQMNCLIDYMPMLSAILFGASSVDTVHVLSLHGVIPEVAAALIPLCEAFGSLMPTSSNKLSTGDEPSIYLVFSSAFLFLLRLWKFYRPPLEQCLMGEGAIGFELTLEYLLLLRNSRIPSNNSAAQDAISCDSMLIRSLDKPIYLDLYPKLRAWYCQNKSCIASPLSGLCTGNPVHQVANKILNMIYCKMTKSDASSGGSATLSSNSFGGSPPIAGEDPYQRPMLTAWEVLEAIPYVLEAILSACAHGKLSSRELITGLKDLIDFLPASIGTIVSYFSAEITRGIWKLVPMNGTDWPSPAAILASVESEMKAILAAAGVDLPSSTPGPSPIMLPLPMATLVSLTITFKLSKSLEYINAVVGPAMENCTSGCPWPSMPVIGSLWAQKVRRWHHFIVVSCARSIFKRNKGAVAQLLRSCFSSFLGISKVSVPLYTDQSSVNGLLGRIIAVPGVCPTIAPGFLYLRSCQTIHDIRYVNNVIIGLVAEYSREAATRWTRSNSPRLKSSPASLSRATAKAREVAILGASLLCASGGMNLVQELYQETVPTWLLSREEKQNEVSAMSHVVEGYAMAYMVIFSGSLVWGIGPKTPPWALGKRAHMFGGHMDFLARVLKEKISLGCHPATWKAYVSCLVGLVVSYAPSWIQELKLETLRKLASGLRGWHESGLALSLLERGGVDAMAYVGEMVNLIH